jgi:hypothetical protein
MKKLPWLLLIGAVVLEVGCGLPDAYFLVPPTVSVQFQVTQQSARILGSDRSTDLNIQFLGYELYYKFYAPNDPNSAYLADQGYGGPNNTVLDLQQHGFQRVTLGPGNTPGSSPDRSPGYSSAPLINVKSIDLASYLTGGYVIDIKMNSGDTGFGFSASAGTLHSFFLYTPPGGSPITGNEIRRFVQAPVYIDNGLLCAPFSSNGTFPSQTPHNYDDGGFAQVDIQSLQTAWLPYVTGGNGTIYVMMYAVAYGLATDQSFQRSSPAYMGYTPIQVIN